MEENTAVSNYYKVTFEAFFETFIFYSEPGSETDYLVHLVWDAYCYYGYYISELHYY